MTTRINVGQFAEGHNPPRDVLAAGFPAPRGGRPAAGGRPPKTHDHLRKHRHGTTRTRRSRTVDRALTERRRPEPPSGAVAHCAVRVGTS
jgi:hypothetical protein